MYKEFGNWRLTDWGVKCERCLNPRHLYEVKHIVWNRGTDWEDGESYYHCPICILKIWINNRTFRIRKRINLFRAWMAFNKEVAPVHYSWKMYSDIFGRKG